MKKIIFGVIAFFCMFSVVALDFVDIFGDVGLGYMNHSMTNIYDRGKLKNQLGSELAGALGEGSLAYNDPMSATTYNALALGLGLKVSYFYTNLSVGFPFKEIPIGYDPLGKELQEFGTGNRVNGSVIFDGQLGAGITLLKQAPLNIFAGIGIGFNYIRTKRNLPKAFVNTINGIKDSKLHEIRSVAMLGIGANLALRYYFTKHIGVCIDVKDTFNFIPLVNKRFYKGTDKDGIPFTYTIYGKKDDKDSENLNKVVKFAFSNNFIIRLGVGFKL